VCLRVEAAWVENVAPTSRIPPLRLSQLVQHRELLFFFAQRDVKARYKQAFLGVAWAVIQPITGALTFTLFFRGVLGIDAGVKSYFAFALVGYIVWSYFSSALSTASGSLVSNSQLLTKVAFPKIVAPVASLLPPLLDLAVGAAIAIIVAIVTGVPFDPLGVFVAVPLGIVLLLAAPAGLALFFGALVVKYRDASVFVGFVLQFLLFASPVAYPPQLVADRWQTIYHLNPIAGALALIRAGLVDGPLPPAGRLVLSFAVAAALLLGGLVYFRINERQLADII
jgi:ABC-type polysaccharide/polyol phosphate export permease